MSHMILTNKDGKTAFEKGNHDVLILILEEGGSVARTCVEEDLLYASQNKNGKFGCSIPNDSRHPKMYLQLRTSRPLYTFHALYCNREVR
jgi:hypothetical protein